MSPNFDESPKPRRHRPVPGRESSRGHALRFELGLHLHLQFSQCRKAVLSPIENATAKTQETSHLRTEPHFSKGGFAHSVAFPMAQHVANLIVRLLRATSPGQYHHRGGRNATLRLGPNEHPADRNQTLLPSILLNPMCARRGMANVNFRVDACCISVQSGKSGRKMGSVFDFHKIDGAAAESAPR